MRVEAIQKLSEYYLKATHEPEKGDEVTAKIINISENDGVKCITLKFDDSLQKQTRKVFFIED